jgi:hypothetical protein
MHIICLCVNMHILCECVNMHMYIVYTLYAQTFLCILFYTFIDLCEFIFAYIGKSTWNYE